MPGIVAHMTIAKLVGDSLHINSDDFIIGNILPDILSIGNNNAHHKRQGKIYQVPDINYWKEKLNPIDDKHLGYLTHLLLDYYFLEEYVPEKVKNKDAFIDKSIYIDYDILNCKLVKRFKLDTEAISMALKSIEDDIDKEKLSYNLYCLKMKEEGETENLDEEDFSKFLLCVSKVISKEIEEYASESSKLPVCPRQRKKRKYKKE